MARQANTSRVCTGHRQPIEQAMSRLSIMKLIGSHHTVPQQMLKASGAAPTPQLPELSIWLSVTDCVLRRK